MKPHPDTASLVLTAPVRPGPLRLCLTASLCLVIGGVLLTLAAGWELQDTQYSILAGLAVPWLALALFAILGVMRQSVRWLEVGLQRDLDGDGLVGDVAPLRIEIAGPEPRTVRLLEIPGVSEQQVRRFAQAAVSGASLAHTNWVGPRRLFKRPQFDALMAELVRGHLVTPGRGNQPRTLTAGGYALLRGIAEQNTET